LRLPSGRRARGGVAAFHRRDLAKSEVIPSRDDAARSLTSGLPQMISMPRASVIRQQFSFWRADVAFPSWPGLPPPSTHHRWGADGRFKPCHDGERLPGLAKMRIACHPLRGAGAPGFGQPARRSRWSRCLPRRPSACCSRLRFSANRVPKGEQ
jgi:hypothetical protein